MENGYVCMTVYVNIAIEFPIVIFLLYVHYALLKRLTVNFLSDLTEHANMTLPSGCDITTFQCNKSIGLGS